MDKDRLEAVRQRSVTLKLKRDALQENKADLEEELSHLRGRIQTLIKVEELFKHLLDRYVMQYAESFSTVVTEGLSTIFYDQDLEFRVVVGQKAGKVWIEFQTIQNGISGSVLDSFGGGVACVESFLLRLLVLLKTGMAKYLILDESFAALSSEYVEDAAKFIRKMCEDLNVTILLVTHNPAFLDYAHRGYQGSLEKVGDMERLKIKTLDLSQD